MTYGLSIIMPSGYDLLGDDKPVIQCIQSGSATASGGATQGYGGVPGTAFYYDAGTYLQTLWTLSAAGSITAVTIPFAVHTVEPPLVFIRSPSPVSFARMLTDSSGKYSGVVIVRPMDVANVNFDYQIFAGVNNLSFTSGNGISAFSSDGGLQFSSMTAPLWLRHLSICTGEAVGTYSTGLTNPYVCINPFQIWSYPKPIIKYSAGMGSYQYGFAWYGNFINTDAYGNVIVSKQLSWLAGEDVMSNMTQYYIDLPIIAI